MLELNWEGNIILLKPHVTNNDWIFYTIAIEVSLIDNGVVEPTDPWVG